jgi:hypothetical protein
MLTSSSDGTLRDYTCQLCGGIDDLLAVANARFAALSRPLTPAERKRYLSDGTSSSQVAEKSSKRGVPTLA